MILPKKTGIMLFAFMSRAKRTYLSTPYQQKRERQSFLMLANDFYTNGVIYTIFRPLPVLTQLVKGLSYLYQFNRILGFNSPQLAA
jgi:hypothetical protein